MVAYLDAHDSISSQTSSSDYDYNLASNRAKSSENVSQMDEDTEQKILIESEKKSNEKI